MSPHGSPQKIPRNFGQEFGTRTRRGQRKRIISIKRLISLGHWTNLPSHRLVLSRVSLDSGPIDLLSVLVACIAMSKRLFWLLLILATALALARQDPENWVEVRSPHFTVVTDSGEKQGRSVAAQFERMRALFQYMYPDLDFDPESPVIVLAIKSQKVFQTLQPGAYLTKENLELRGWFLGDSGKKYILMRLDRNVSDQFPVAYHEYTHLLLEEVSDTTPLWLDEGLAEFYGNTKIYDRKVLLGEPNQPHLMLLRSEKLLPLATLFTVGKDSPYYIEKKRGSIFYAESWALAHYLTMKDYEKKTSKIEQYKSLVEEKVDPVTAGMRAFGDLKKLEKSLDSYIRQQNLKRLETANISKVDDSEFETQALNAIQAQVVEADFLACSGRLAEARTLVDRVLQQDPENEAAQTTRAFLDSEDEAQAERRLRSTIQADPSAAAAYDQLAVFLWKRGKNMEETGRLASKAVSLDANNVSFRIHQANILLSQGDEEAAIKSLRAAAALAKTSEETAAVDRLLSEAMAYASSIGALNNEAREKNTIPPEEAAVPARPAHHDFLPAGPHRFVVGLIQDVRCDPPTLDLTVTSQAKSVTLHSDNYYQIQFTALFAPAHDLQPCRDLEDRPAKVEYVESADGRETPRLIAVELRK
jgi:tetratricopeptide (TPR) repeat protein